MKFVMRDVTPRVRHEEWNEGLATRSQGNEIIVSIYIRMPDALNRTISHKLGNVEARQERVGISERGALEIQYKPRLSEDTGNKRTMLIMISQKAFMLLNSGKIFDH